MNKLNVSMTESEKILLIDDDVELTSLIKQFLSMNGYQVEVEHNGEDAVKSILKYQPDLIVLDLMLPGVDGLTICRQARDDFSGPIIMLTALNDDIDEVTGLEVGADDYLCKPIKPRVLLAHIRAQLRRQSNLNKFSQQDIKTVNSGELIIDARKRIVTYQGLDISLTSAEFDLLWVLALNAGNIISRDQLHLEIFRLEFDGFDRSIDLRISRLRKKLGDDPKEPQIIKTIRNKGYLLAN
ncbi:two-component system, OmpR family, response regulator RstA [Pseudoalteromonas denitrificans DSM 6059]|uniref:Two-component system, OmpR family, response regulator RstA n=2 Tax=Pseudoalteromonas TaxID=53246 RepID=A0A1I1NZG7_9GAMM|nr:two-component system, OmpR family, response regulator RstA [Pseudoalteromonas denitrificans DSM 6059]